LVVIDENDNSIIITDGENEEENWGFNIFTNDSNGNTAVLTTKKEGDLLWTDGNKQVYGVLPQNPQTGVVYQLIDSNNENYNDGYYKYINNIWV